MEIVDSSGDKFVVVNGSFAPAFVRTSGRGCYLTRSQCLEVAEELKRLAAKPDPVEEKARELYEISAAAPPASGAPWPSPDSDHEDDVVVRNAWLAVARHVLGVK